MSTSQGLLCMLKFGKIDTFHTSLIVCNRNKMNLCALSLERLTHVTHNLNSTCHTSHVTRALPRVHLRNKWYVNLLIVKLTGKLTKCSLFLKCVAEYIILFFFFRISIKIPLFLEVDFNKIEFQGELLISSYT